METVILVNFRVKGLPAPIKIASAHEPNKEQIHIKLQDIKKQYDLDGEIEFQRQIEEKGQKMYIYRIGSRRCRVIVEKLEKIFEFEKISEVLDDQEQK